MKQYGSQSYRYHLILLQLYKKERGNLKSAFIESDLKPIINKFKFEVESEKFGSAYSSL
jgi:hypothetical protein